MLALDLASCAEVFSPHQLSNQPAVLSAATVQEHFKRNSLDWSDDILHVCLSFLKSLKPYASIKVPQKLEVGCRQMQNYNVRRTEMR